MPRDYKSRANTAQRRERRPSGWVLFISGLLVGLFVSGLAWLKLSPTDDPAGRRLDSPVAQQARPPVEPEEPEESDAPRPRFDFYTILPEMEVVVPEPKPAARTEAPAPPPRVSNVTKPDVTAGRYMLQMGSFKTFSDADRLKASLALVGIEADIQKVRIEGGAIFHRVRSGPYDERRVNALRTRLRQNNINNLVIRLK
jgi:cell division protein FtsN